MHVKATNEKRCSPSSLWRHLQQEKKRNDAPCCLYGGTQQLKKMRWWWVLFIVVSIVRAPIVQNNSLLSLGKHKQLKKIWSNAQIETTMTKKRMSSLWKHQQQKKEKEMNKNLPWISLWSSYNFTLFKVLLKLLVTFLKLSNLKMFLSLILGSQVILKPKCWSCW
jgi:hypothetical protein